MKTLYLLFGFALMGVLFFACQKDENTLDDQGIYNTALSQSRSIDCDCGDDAGACQYLCLPQGQCCCRLFWYFDDTTVTSPIPTYCKAWDVWPGSCSVGTVYGTDCGVDWPGLTGDFCSSTFDFPSNPYHLRPTFLCVPQNTGIRIVNSHPTENLNVIMQCAGPMGNQNLYIIPGNSFIIIGFDDCLHTSCR